MDYEIKYKIALENARQFSEHPLLEDSACIVEYIFPELKKSEDERIRKALIEYFNDANKADENPLQVYGIHTDKVITWLEKQGDKDSVGVDNIPLESSVNYVVTNSNKKQGEQKPVDKVEPKFKVGDWVIDKQNIVHQIANVIENVTNHTYGYDIVGGGYFNDSIEGVRLWTIKDAKDGDVLQLGEVTAIFKEFIGNGNCICYCSICNGEFEIPTQDGADNSYECHNATPATKEQRDQLEEAMAYAGYRWKAETKELIKVPRSKESTGVLKQLLNEEKSWSKEDERICNGIISDIAVDKTMCEYDISRALCDKRIAWLGRLKHRIGG